MKKTRIKVNTSAGMANSAEVGDCIGQGTAGAALVSKVDFDYGLLKYFSDSKEEMYYGKFRLQPMVYQDNIAKPSKSVIEARAGCLKLFRMLQEKGLEAHPDKICFIVIGTETFKKNI